MKIEKKLEILSAAAKYDVSCVSSGSTRKARRDGLGNTAASGICHSFASDGRCISLLKILYTNRCIYDCRYCVNRSSGEVPRASFTEEEVIDLTMNFYLRNYIEGLFLSSAITISPDYTMERLVAIVKNLRVEKRFNGYIHLKALPGADAALLHQAGLYVDRLSANIELPSSESLGLLAPDKEGTTILGSMKYIGREIIRSRDEKKKFRKAPSFVPAGQSTQLIVGASPESDSRILTLSESLYRAYTLKRVFYSAYMPVNEGPGLPPAGLPPLRREHRLYQADWLLRFYGFKAGELFTEAQQNLDETLDPKTGWALAHLDLFPLEINKVPYEMLLRVPGIGVRSAQRIAATRRVHSLSLEDLTHMGIVMKRARHFITAGGQYSGGGLSNRDSLKRILGGEVTRQASTVKRRGYEQLSLFPEILPSPQEEHRSYQLARTGEL